MSFRPDIATVIERIASAEADREMWRTAGMHEQYLEVVTRLRALSRLLDELRREAGEQAPDDTG